MPLSSQAVLEKWGPIAAADPEGGSGPFRFWFVDEPSGQAATPSVTPTVNPVADTAPKVDSRCHTTLTGCSFVSLPSLIVSPQPKKTRLLAEADSVLAFPNCS